MSFGVAQEETKNNKIRLQKYSVEGLEYLKKTAGMALGLLKVKV
jgi:hypothetical protein